MHCLNAAGREVKVCEGERESRKRWSRLPRRDLHLSTCVKSGVQVGKRSEVEEEFSRLDLSPSLASLGIRKRSDQTHHEKRLRSSKCRV